MNIKGDQSRITIDIPKKDHKKLKTLSALLGKSMREIIIESIETLLYHSKEPNKETLKAIKEVEKRKNLTEVDNLEDLFKKLDI